MSEERRRILDLLAAGKITSDEAERLLDALGRGTQEPAPAGHSTDEPKPGKPKYLRVLVQSGEGRGTVNVRVPLLLVRAGIKLSSLMPQKTREKVNDALERQGMSVNLDELTGEQLETILSSMKDMTIDVADGKDHVRVFCE